MRGEKIRYKTVQTEARTIKVRFAQVEERDAARLLLENEYRDFVFTHTNDDRSWFIELGFNEIAMEEEKRSAIQQNI